nr:hypothetical protein [Tanacetum cinerariifolium]
MSTKIELTLEQSQQGVSYDVLVSIEGVEELKRNVWIKGENKAALQTLLGRDQPFGFLSKETCLICHEDSSHSEIVDIEDKSSWTQ